MYTCDQALELLSARLDGALTPEEEAGLEEHLAQCPECRALAADLAELHDAMPGLYQAPPPELKERVMAQIRAENAPISLDEVRKKRSGRKTWRTWGAMAAVMAVVFMSAVAMRFGHDGDTAGMPENTPVQSAAVYSVQPENGGEAGTEGAQSRSVAGDGAQSGESAAEKSADGAVPDEAMLMEGAGIDSVQPQPAGKVYYDRLPEGWEKLFPDVAGVDAMCVSGEEAQAFLELLKEQNIPYAVEGDLSGKDGDVQLLSGLPE